jgi:hypothetical protein
MKRAITVLVVVLLIGGLAVLAYTVDWPSVFQAINPHR